MNKLALLVGSPEQLSRRRRQAFERELANVDIQSQAEEHARPTELIGHEDEFQKRLGEQRAARHSTAGQSRWRVSAKGLLQLLGLTVVVFVVVGVKRAFFG